MSAYLRVNPPARSQYRSPRRLDRSPLPGRVTGCTVLHTAESVMDTVGPDTGAEAVARFIRGRAEPGSYHDLVDSDSGVQLVEYGDEAYQDGTGSNPWALSLAFACRTTDWARMTEARQDAYLEQGARVFARQQAWRKAHGHPATLLRYITREQSEQGASGFIYHGHRDPGRRTDPGLVTFPRQAWLDACRAATTTTTAPEDDAMTPDQMLAALNDARVADRLVQIVLDRPDMDNDPTNGRQSLRERINGLAAGQRMIVDEQRAGFAQVLGRIPDPATFAADVAAILRNLPAGTVTIDARALKAVVEEALREHSLRAAG